MVNASSDLITERSCASAASAALVASGAEAVASASVGVASWFLVVFGASSPASLAVVPLFPVVGGPGPGGVVAEDGDKDLAEEGAVLGVAEVVDDAFEREDPADELENEPEIRQRLRAFHTV